MEIISIIIAFVSLCVSFVSLFVSRGVAPSLHRSGIDIFVHGDGFDLLFAENGCPCDEQAVKMVNGNNRDILVFLQFGYICNDTTKYYLKSEYYKLMANDVTTIQVKVDKVKIDNPQEKDSKYVFVFKYRGLLWNRTKRITEKG